MTERSETPTEDQLERLELRLALQRLASGHYNRPDVLRIVASKILRLEDENQV